MLFCIWALSLSTGTTHALPSSYAGGVISINDRQDLTEVNIDIADNTILKNVGGGVWLLNASLHNNIITNKFYMNSSSVSWLKINSTGNNCFYYLNEGTTNISGATITSWNTTTLTTETKEVSSTCRSYVYSFGVFSTMNISNSNLSYLGYNAWDSYGVMFDSTDKNTLIHNNFTNNYRGLELATTNGNNITFNNITSNSDQGIYLFVSDANIISNNNISNNANVGLYSWLEINNNIISNNTINNNYRGLFIDSDLTGDISNNNLISWNNVSSNSIDGMYVRYVSNETIFNNTNNNNGEDGIKIYHSRDGRVYNNTVTFNFKNGIELFNTSNITIYNNAESYSDISSIKISSSKYVFNNNNTISSSDIGYFILDSNNIDVTNSSITNMTKNSDTYDVGIFVYENSNHVNISLNNISDIGTTCVLIMKNNSEINVSNNYCDLKNINEKFTTTDSSDWNEPETGISIVETFKSFLTDASEADHDGYSKISKYNSSNITLLNNTFGSNVQVLLYTEGTKNLTHDLTNYWEFNYSFPRLTDPSHFYISNSYNILTSISYVSNRTVTKSAKQISNVLQKQYSHMPNQPPGTLDGTETFFRYIVQKNNIYIYPMAYDRYSDGTVVNHTDSPYDFYIYSPLYATVGINKNHTIFSNGTTYLKLYNDTLEPNGYHVLNMVVQPSLDNITLNVTTWNINGEYRRRFTVSSNTHNNPTSYILGDFPENTYIQVNKNGVIDAYYLSNSSGYITFTHNIYSDLTIEAFLAKSALEAATCPNVNTSINTAFKLVGVLLIIFASMLVIQGIRNMNGTIIVVGIGTNITGAIMIIIGYFITVTISNGVGCV